MLALSLVAPAANATKARMSALQYANFWVDTQNIFEYPQYISKLGQFATFELGPTGAFGTSPKAEGGFFKKLSSGGILGAYLGHTDGFIGGIRNKASSAQQQNPVYIGYANGDTGYGFSFSYANIKSTTEKDLTLGANFGTKVNDINLGAQANFYSVGEKAGVKTTVAPSVLLSADTQYTTWNLYGNAFAGFYDTGVAANVFAITLGAQDHGVKLAEKGTFFYGSEASVGFGTAPVSVALPVYVGLEMDVASFAAVRGSLSQNLLVGFNKAAAGTDFNKNDTKVSFGGSLKVGKLQLDSLLAVGTSGALNGTTFMTNAGLSYFF